MRIIFLGKPASGKGTQALKLAAQKDFKIISTGDIIRHEIRTATLIGKQLDEYMSKGELVPDDIIVDLILSKLNYENVIFDGFPRTINQAKFLETKIKVDKVIFLHVEDEVVINRIKNRIDVLVGKKTIGFESKQKAEEYIAKHGGEIVKRNDSDEQIVKKRLNIYQEQTKPLIAYYKSLGRFESVNSDRPIEQVYQDILKIIR